MKFRLIYILPGLFAIALIALVLRGIFGPSEACYDKKLFVDSAYTGVIVKKYHDGENHNFRTILYSIGNKLSIMRLVDDTSGYYEFVKPGDSIYKLKNSEYINVNNTRTFTIYFDCN